MQAPLIHPMFILAVVNRITLHSESAQQMHAREIVFEPFDAHYNRDCDPTNEPVLLRARKELLEADAMWYVRLLCDQF